MAGIAGVVATAVFGALVAAQSGTGIQGYAADRPLDSGTIVELTGENADRIKAATQEELQNMFGVVVDRNQLPVTISSEGLENEAFVAVSGTYTVLVSTQGGDISSGDYLTLSSLSGIAMKAGTEEAVVFGRANAPFNESSVTRGTTTLRDTDGNQRTVSLGAVPVTIDIRRNPNEVSTTVNVPEPLQRVGEAIAEKEVSPIRIYLSLAIATISTITALVIIYAGIRNGVISIGRNPMSKKSIFRALLEVILTSFLILIIGLFAVYLLLRL